MAKVIVKELLTQHDRRYGWDVVVELCDDETYQDGVDALCASMGLDYDDEKDADSLHNRRIGCNQLNWVVK